jgi:hypothetical protein
MYDAEHTCCTFVLLRVYTSARSAPTSPLWLETVSSTSRYSWSLLSDNLWVRDDRYATVMGNTVQQRKVRYLHARIVLGVGLTITSLKTQMNDGSPH